MMSKRLLVLTKYARLGASSRMRFLQYFPFLVQQGFELTHQAFISDGMLKCRYDTKKYRFLDTLRCYWLRILILMKAKHYDLVWIQAESLPYFPAFIELFFLRKTRFVLEYDDAIFHNYDQHRLFLIRFLFGRRLDRLMNKAALVIAGNAYLAQRARDAGCKRVEIIPTVVDLTRYEVKLDDHKINQPLKIVWIGTQSTVKYLHNLKPILRKVYKTQPFILRVIGACLEDDLLDIECLSWSEKAEATDIRNADIGIMPLMDSCWERGKCGYKLIQYIACGLPVIGSAVGVNVDIIENGNCGFLAETTKDWENTLSKLLASRKLRVDFGLNGRCIAESDYSMQAQQPRLVSLLKSVCEC
ncbi:glycosyltransferase family 4 protein [Marinomonas sp.]|uniref:glycosyltransferase family 4 protein n=1 Tax=Marinomonas sp. TaxID=1904862 RepID=UPI003A908C3F